MPLFKLLSDQFGRFVRFSDYFATECEEAQVYRKLAGKDQEGNHLCVPLVVSNRSQELRVYGIDGFNSNFVGIASLIANPGQGKSRLATAMYNIMRGTNEDYFKTSDSAVSFTKGVWRLSDYCKKKLLSKDYIDILDVEGLQKENSVYYLLIAVIVLSKSIVLLSRERINKEAFAVLEIAFKILNRLGIALKKPVIFIQTKMNKEGLFLDEFGRAMTKNELIRSVSHEIPMIKSFEVEFFRLREVPVLDVLEDSGCDSETAQHLVSNASKLYEADVCKLLELLNAVKDPLPSEQRMHYLIKVIDHLNNKNPDLVLEQNLDFFQKDAERWLIAEMLREEEELVQKHLAKPLGDAKTLEQFFEAPKNDLKERFFHYCYHESPFLGNAQQKDAYIATANEVFNNSHYAKGVLKTADPATGKVIGIMSYALASFEAKKKTDENILMDIYMMLRNELDNIPGYDAVINEPPQSAPDSAFDLVKQSYPNMKDISNLTRDRWNQVCVDVRNKRNRLLYESKWIEKIRSEGDLTCRSCSTSHCCDYISHKKCCNKNSVPTIMWYWVKESSKHGICSGCDEVRVIQSVHCWECNSKLAGRIVPPHPVKFSQT